MLSIYGIKAATLNSYDEVDNYRAWLDDDEPCLMIIPLPEESFLTPKIKFETGVITPKLSNDVVNHVYEILRK